MRRWLWIYPFVGGVDWVHSLNLADAPDSGYQGGAGLGNPAYAPTGLFNRFAITWSGVIHNASGVLMNNGTGNTNCDMADATNCYNAWNRRSHGVYSRTNTTATNARDMTAQFVEPRNGFTYLQGIHVRNADGITYGQLCYYAKSGVTTTSNQTNNPTTDSLGLFSDSQRGPYYGCSHYLYKRGVWTGVVDNTPEVGMGYGDVGSGAWMYLTGIRNFAFFFSTVHTRTLDGPLNPDGTGGLLPGNNGDWNYFVEQLQVALGRAV